MNSKIKKTVTVQSFIGDHAKYDEHGGFIWGVDKKGDMQIIGEVRGWGAIQNLFKTQSEAADFQDNLGMFIAEAINEKLKSMNVS